MTVRELRDAIRQAPPLGPADSAARAIRMLRARGVPALPVAAGQQLVGMVSEADLMALAAAAADPEEALRQTPVSELVRPLPLIAAEEQSLASLAEAMRESSPAAVPVADRAGRYLGLILPRDVLAALLGEPVMPPIAGLATPAGVHLTTGALRAGAGNLALAGTGAALMALSLIADGVIRGFFRLLSQTLEAPPPVQMEGGVAVAAVAVLYGLRVGVFLLLLRLSPLTRVHGAEHMVVRALEEGVDLTPEKVRGMSRVHPRCGTNLMALLILLMVAQQFLSSLSGVLDGAMQLFALLVLVMIILVTWRRLGAGLQRWVTTRDPTERQLAKAIEVATDLVGRVRARPSAAAGVPRRIWNMGFLQVVAGFVSVALVVEYAPRVWVVVWNLITG